jgi:hypothetical protein
MQKANSKRAKEDLPGGRNNNVSTRVARWFILIPKIPIWVNFGGP